MNTEPLDEKYKSFGWNYRINGNLITEILEAFQIFKGEINKPTVIIADTVAGKGVSFLEGRSKISW